MKKVCKSSGIGGQAVLEGIMMKNQEVYSIGVRKPDGEIEVNLSTHEGIGNKKLKKVPIIRGVINFIDSLVLGMKCLTFSASFYDEEEARPSKTDVVLQKVFKERAEKVVMGVTVAFSIVIAIAIFMILPYYLADILRQYIVSDTVLAVVEGAIRLLLFISYVLLISRMKDIQRVFQYHGAEHKCINCIETGLELNVENVRKSSKHHRRCGTSFMLIVMVISIIFFIFIRVDSPILRVVYRVALVPVIAGVSYEFIRFAGNTNNLLIRILSIPGMWLQALTTKEPDDDMIEVAIAAVEAVFDWRAYQGRSEENPLEAEVPAEEEAKETEKQTQEETETAKEEEEAEEPTLEKEPEQTEDNESAEEAASDKEADELQDIEDILEAKE
ncbi:MAG: DUF1385 domain-containing protein [Lachnospiraceae bacterium]|jgi:uncharacterized protein YqhQ|nr:DUF1385 domain-containing protein [Lachnospiraceae bacterium]